MKLRFFCDRCGTEVRRGTPRCPTCGHFFTAVQCPRCGFQGQESDFASGCLTCGYMGKVSPEPRQPRRRHRPTKTEAQPEEPVGAPASFYRWLGILLAASLVALLVLFFIIL